MALGTVSQGSYTIIASQQRGVGALCNRLILSGRYIEGGLRDVRRLLSSVPGIHCIGS